MIAIIIMMILRIIIKRAKEASRDIKGIATYSMEGREEFVSQYFQLYNPGIYFIIFTIIQRQ